ncbi:hypothetical protein ACFL1P_00605 [Patescibacteria group bacterium]
MKKSAQKKIQKESLSLFLPVFVILLLVFVFIQNSNVPLFSWKNGIQSISPTPTRIVYPTPTPIVGEILLNGSFEFDSNEDEMPDDWKLHDVNSENISSVICTEAHSGNCSLEIQGDELAVIKQYISVEDIQGNLIKISGWSKAKNVTNISRQAPGRYWIQAVLYYKDGSVDYRQHSTFDDGTHDWQKVELTTTISHPLSAIEYYIRFEKSGVAWFDDLNLTIE